MTGSVKDGIWYIRDTSYSLVGFCDVSYKAVLKIENALLEHANNLESLFNKNESITFLYTAGVEYIVARSSYAQMILMKELYDVQ